MQTETRVFELDGVKYRLRPNDMNYFAKVEELTGHRENTLIGIRVTASNVLAVLYAAIWADYAARDMEPPVTQQQVGAKLNTPDLRQSAVDAVAEILGLNLPDVKEGAAADADPQPAPAKRSRSRGATRSARSTSDSANASSGA